MKTATIATNLTDDSTNVTVSNLEELQKFIKFFGNDSFYVYTCFGWQTVSEFCMSNPIEYLF